MEKIKKVTYPVYVQVKALVPTVTVIVRLSIEH